MIFRGTATALVTPFTDDKVDAKALERLVDFQLENGVDALCVLGTTGEPSTMSEYEKRQVVQLVTNRVAGKIPVIVGAGSNSTAQAVHLSKMAQSLGADGLLIVTPYYNKCTQDGLVKHYSEIASATSLPIIVYNVPSRTGVNVLAKTMQQIAKIDNVVGIKEASGNMAQILECLRTVGKDIAVYSGDDALALPIIASGGQGLISVASNIYPKYVSTLCNLALKGQINKANQMQLAMLPLINALFCEVNPIPVKKALQLKGLCKNNLRLPLTQMSDDNATSLKKAMEDFEKHCSTCAYD